ncbi:MAG TPA: hypothetical protein VNW46_11310, partial [Gemmatimonadaceae bacterium]|nr:hypothetical protein [Gemmatimonadaceae bacterium]
SLRLNMPAISVRDLEVKDDSICLCADLVAATHGRGYWILDDITPLRQASTVRSRETAFLFKPAMAVRVRFATNDPTPWPPELPAGENPPAGATLDYYVPAGATGAVRLDILDAHGTRIRSYASDDASEKPDPARDPDAYMVLCQQKPTTRHCALPLYWPAPAMVLPAEPGMHRIAWDLHYQPIPTEEEPKGEEEEARGAVPHRTEPTVDAPWAPPGAYTVRLTVGDHHVEQPLTLRLDPRVTTPAAGLARLAMLSRDMYDDAVAGRRAYAQARALAAQLAHLSGDDVAAFAARVDSLAPAPHEGERPQGRRGAAVTTPQTLESIADASLAAAMAMQSADVTPTAAQSAACQRAHAQLAEVLARWTALKTTGLATFNAKRKAAGRPIVTIAD